MKVLSGVTRLGYARLRAWILPGYQVLLTFDCDGAQVSGGQGRQATHEGAHGRPYGRDYAHIRIHEEADR